MWDRSHKIIYVGVDMPRILAYDGHMPDSRKRLRMTDRGEFVLCMVLLTLYIIAALAINL